jgi:hypothetical protein
MDILSRYPEMVAAFTQLCETRRDEILQAMTDTDDEYDRISRLRTDASMELRDRLGEDCSLLEKYTDAVYMQETYELDAVYRQGFLDALDALTERGLL